MEMPFLEQQISHIDNYGNFKEKLNNAFIIAHKRNENKNLNWQKYVSE